MTPGQVWGATPAELDAQLPCDSMLSGTVTVCDRSIAVQAEPWLVFAWLCQLRATPYSYDRIRNLGRPSPSDRDPALSELAVGQEFMGAFELVDFTPDEHITLLARPRVAVTYAVHRHELPGANAPVSTRLHVRVRFAGPRVIVIPVVFGDFIMMRKQLLTLKELAEREARVVV
ncbi:hypothetical protein HLB23_30395 [Nocardia uniformis]|uniref:Uncharacterized protein n=1 Tax=Nocardia uniformis TaxID=53432 RepID=A0A849C600_9NOCA|nr:hypothetical protein [Nocardia uniformis]NNH74114.1 hypothetical protein [Nocardia uniformis]